MSESKIGVAYGAFTTVDEYGRDGTCLGWFSTREAATKAAVNKGFYGSHGNVTPIDTITVDGLTYRLFYKTPIAVDDSDEKKVAVQKQALTKLTAEERAALGF